MSESCLQAFRDGVAKPGSRLFKEGITLGRKKLGSLTADKIKKLSTYYSRTIRGGENAEEMRKAILASLHHNHSTDEFPQHQFCPPGKDSWSFYKRDVKEKKYSRRSFNQSPHISGF